jgi:hypothetical protein
MQVSIRSTPTFSETCKIHSDNGRGRKIQVRKPDSGNSGSQAEFPIFKGARADPNARMQVLISLVVNSPTMFKGIDSKLGRITNQFPRPAYAGPGLQSSPFPDSIAKRPVLRELSS